MTTARTLIILRFVSVFTLFSFPVLLSAQKPVKPTAADIHQQIKKLNVLGSVLYVAAHPDDENQRFISYCANYRLFDVTYLSLTRGDGGQNLIGPELREMLGVLRTEELLMARSVDGGRQMFSRANDFGYSKTPDETFRIWDRDAVLSDVVRAIRQTQPDVIVNRFHHDKKYPTHGHHTASAMLSVEAFDLAGRADKYPDQLIGLKPWQARRVFFNTSWFFFGGKEAFEKVDKSHLFSLDLGVWLPLKGKSNNEIAAEARSMHRCQGFGAMSSRGESLDYFDWVKGDKPAAKNDIFEGINTTWTRIEGGAPIGKRLAEIDRNFRPDDPAASAPALMEAMQMIEKLPESYWRNRKLHDIRQTIKNCLGIYLESTSATPVASPGEEITLRLEAIQRAGSPVRLREVRLWPGEIILAADTTLPINRGWIVEKPLRLPQNTEYTSPYWLLQPFTEGMYAVDQSDRIGLPESPRSTRVVWVFEIKGQVFEYETDVAYKVEESAIGEVWRPFEVLPPVFVQFEEDAYIFPKNKTTHQVTIRVRAGRDSVSGVAYLNAPAGWNVSAPAETQFSFQQKGEEKTFVFGLEPQPDAQGKAVLDAVAIVEGQKNNLRLTEITYEHIPRQSVLTPAAVSAALVDLKITSTRIGYYHGAGDDLPACLRQIGCDVTILGDKDLSPENLAQYDAVILGVRAYNTQTALATKQKALFEYVEKGGILLTQYNTNFDWVGEKNAVGPYPMEISRNRVTDEKAEVRFESADHPVLKRPNALKADDFTGWVQERGLYFPSTWHEAYAAPLSMSDPDEKPTQGALLVANYGKGRFVYTGLSFFRELPAGVPGAYRLLANLISK